MNVLNRLGVCTWTFGERPLAEVAGRLKSLGFAGVEWFGNLGGGAVEPLPARQVRHILDDHGLQIFSITPDNVDLAHPDPAVRQEAMSYYLRLLDFAAELGGPLVSCHGFVGRVRAIDSPEAEEHLLQEAVRALAQEAGSRGLRLVFEVLNRYESHLINTGAQAKQLVEAISSSHLGILLDAYHMNIEEPDPAGALRAAGDRLWLYHVADSNRQAVGRGHTDFMAQFAALEAIGYTGPVICECTAPGPDPFQAIKEEGSLTWLETYLAESRTRLLDLAAAF